MHEMKIRIYPAKSAAMRFRLTATYITSLLLGFERTKTLREDTFDSKMTFDYCIEYIVPKALKTLDLIHRFRNVTSDIDLRTPIFCSS